MLRMHEEITLEKLNSINGSTVKTYICLHIERMTTRSLNISKQTQPDCNHNIHSLTKISRASHPKYNNVDCAVVPSVSRFYK